jgi:hypothetical protein
MPKVYIDVEVLEDDHLDGQFGNAGVTKTKKRKVMSDWEAKKAKDFRKKMSSDINKTRPGKGVFDE